jgi:hypothetical protein
MMAGSCLALDVGGLEGGSVCGFVFLLILCLSRDVVSEIFPGSVSVVDVIDNFSCLFD